MARPPEPLSDLIAEAKIIAIAEVVQVLALGPKPPPPPNARKLGKGASDVGYVASFQKVRLKIERCLLGQLAVGSTIDVEKPEAPYVLRQGDKGPFFIGDKN